MTKTCFMHELRHYSLIENAFLFRNSIEVNLLICQNERSNKNDSNFRQQPKNLCNCARGKPVVCFEKMHACVYKVSYCKKCCMFQLLSDVISIH